MDDFRVDAIEPRKGRSWKLPRHTFKVLVYVFFMSMMFGHLFLMLANVTRYSLFLDLIKGKGEPTSLADIERPIVPKDQNGAKFVIEATKQPFVSARVYVEFYEIYKDYDELELEYNDIDDYTIKQLRKSAQKREIVRGWLKANEYTIDLIKKGEKFAQADFNYHYDDKSKWEQGFWNYGTVQLMNILNCNVYLAIAENNNKQALENFKVLTEYTKFWKHELTWDTYVNIVFAYQYSRETLYHIVNELNLTPEEIDFAYDCYLTVFNALNVKKYLTEQRCLYLDYIDFMDKYDWDSFDHDYTILWDIPPPMRYLAGQDNLVKDMLLKTIAYQTRLLDMCGKPYAEIENELNKMIMPTQNRFDFWDFVLDNSGIEMFRDYFDAVALKRIIHTTLAIMKFEIANNRIPKNLEELKEAGFIDKIPKSPFTGQQLIYEIEDGKYRLFCAGSNGALFKNTCDCIVSHLSDQARNDIEWDYTEEDEYEE